MYKLLTALLLTSVVENSSFAVFVFFYCVLSHCRGEYD